MPPADRSINPIDHPLASNNASNGATRVANDAAHLRPPLNLPLARWMTALFIVGLVLSGLTAMPVITQLRVVTYFIARDAGGIGEWLWRVRDAAEVMARDMPFMFYGYDWLAFGHIGIALAFVPAWRDPVTHRWLYTYGLVLCGLVVVWAMAVGPFRGIPLGWRLIDCSFGVIGALPLLIARRATRS